MTGELLYSETTLLGRASPRHTRHGPHWTGCFTSRRPKRGCNACVSARTLNDVQQPVKPHAHLAPKSDVYLLRSDGLSCSREIVEGATTGRHWPRRATQSLAPTWLSSVSHWGMGALLPALSPIHSLL